MKNVSSKQLENSLELTLRWFLDSGVMIPQDGTWGVAERVLLTENNAAMEQTYREFAAWTPHDGYSIIEQRRADCCLETVYLFLKLYELSGRTRRELFDKAENMLDFLYFRSGLLNRFGPETLVGTWQWSHIMRRNAIWFDDNAWMAALALKIARAYPAFDRKYEMRSWAMLLADRLAETLPRYLENPKSTEEKFKWAGPAALPHWGSLVCLALAEAYRTEPKKTYTDVISLYEDHLLRNADTFTTSEFGYALTGCMASYRATGSEKSLRCAERFAEKTVAAMDPETGAIPSEHDEAPKGKALADTIYTLNWALLGMQCVSSADARFRPALDKIIELLIRIQDRTEKPHLSGCWRGMYDFETQSWGGGDRYEGGANSIYTGWTNAPIAWGMAFELLNSDLARA